MGPPARTCGDTRGCRTAPAASWRTMRQAWSSITLSTTSSGFTRPSLDAGNDRWVINRIGFLERQRAGRAAAAVQKFTFPIDLHFDAPHAMIAEFAVQLTAVLPDGPEVFAGPRLRRRGRAVGGVKRVCRS